MDQPVGAFDDAVIVGDHDHRRLVRHRRFLEQLDDHPRRILVEGRGRLVGEDQAGVIDQGPRDRHPLALAAREQPRLVVDPMAEAEPLQELQAMPAPDLRRLVTKLLRHLDVFVGGQRLEQVVHLKDEADLAAHRDQIVRRQPPQVATQHRDPTLMHRAQGADQGQQRGLAGARGAGHHDELARRDLDPVVEQDLIARDTLAVIVVERVDRHDRRRRRRDFGRARGRSFGDHRGAHQNTSAGSAATTRRTAIAAEIRHMPRVSPRLNRVIPRLIRIGSSANPADDPIEQDTREPRRNPACEPVQRRLLEHHAQQKQGRIADRFQRRILRQLVGHVGIGDLIGDQHADDKADHRADREYRPGRRHLGLKLALERDQLVLGHDRKPHRQRLFERGLHAGRVGPRRQLDHPGLDPRRVSGGAMQHIGKGAGTHDHRAVARRNRGRARSCRRS